MPDKIVTVGRTKHGKWTYYTGVIYSAELRKDKVPIYKKQRVFVETTSANKTERLAREYASEHGLPFKFGVRQNDKVTNPRKKKNPKELLKQGEWTPAHAVRIRKGRLEIMR